GQRRPGWQQDESSPASCGPCWTAGHNSCVSCWICHLALSPQMLDTICKGRCRGGKMDTMAGTSKLVESERRDQFIPVRKEDLFSTLIKQGDLADPVERELFWRFARTLRTICHYEYSETLDRLRDDYYYFNPEVAGHAT